MKNKTSFDVLIILAAGLMCFTFLNSYPVSILDESKNVEAAREMIESGDYWIPKFNGELRTDKPPLHYYFMVIGMKLFGVNELGVRFFSALMGFTLILFFFNFCNRYLDKKQAYISTIIFLSSFFFMHEFRLAVPDPYLITFIALSLFSFFEYFEKKKIKFLILFYFFVALGSLTKGPVAILLPGLSVGLFLLLKKQLKNVFSYYPILGIVGVLLVTSPWYINVHLLTDGEWTKGFFIEHNLNRFGSEMEGHGGIFLITFGYVLLGLLPFSFFIPQALINSYKERFSWRFNLSVLKYNLKKISHANFCKGVSDLDMMFVKGENSDYINSKDLNRIRNHFSNSKFCEISNAGHWVHAENPNDLYDEIINFL